MSAAAGGTWGPIPTFSSPCSRSFEREMGGNCIFLGKREAWVRCLSRAGLGCCFHDAKRGRDGSGYATPSQPRTEQNRSQLSTLLAIRTVHRQKRGICLKVISSRTGAGSKDREEEILYPFSFSPIWPFACVWILGRFGSGFGGNLSETYTEYTWGGIYYRHIPGSSEAMSKG